MAQLARTGPLGDEAAVAEKRRQEKLEALQWVEDLRAVLGTPAGRRLYHRLAFSTAGAMNLSFRYRNNATDTAFNEGRRDVGLSLVSEAQEHVPELYLLMVQEHIEDAGRRARAAEAKQPETMESDE